MKFYGAFQKVEEQDDGTIKVWGIASSEAVDGAGEVVKADAMRAALPEYMKFANIREMHGKTAAGVAFEAYIDDGGFTHIGAHIVDPISVKKVQTKVLKGFSIGGGNVERDKADKSIITGLKLTEISLVDRPCNPDSVISLWKADGLEAPNTEPEKTARQIHCEKRAQFLLQHPDTQELLKTLAIFAGDRIEKGLWQVAELARVIGNLFDLQQGIASEAAYEGDGSPIPGELSDAVKSIGEILQRMVAEELKELYPDEGDDMNFDNFVIQMAAQIEALKKTSDAILAKGGAKHSADTLKSLQGMHDTLATMTAGTVCEGTDKAAKAETLAKMVSDHDSLQKAFNEQQVVIEKALKERDELQKVLKESEETLLKAAAEIDKLKAEPAPTTTVLRAGLHLVEKTAAETQKVEPVKLGSTIDKAATGIKEVFASGGRGSMY